MSSDEETKGYVVRIRGLPWSASKPDVVSFFSDSKILEGEDGVKLIYGKDARPTGEAFLEFFNQNDMDNAFKKHNKHMGKRYIEVYRSQKSEMEWVMKRAGEDAVKPKEGQCVRLRGLPYGCTKEDIIQFFSGLQIKANGIILMTDLNRRPSGEAYVRFSSEEEAEKSLKKHKEKIGHRYIEIFKCSPQEVTNATINMRRVLRTHPMERVPPMPSSMSGFAFPPPVRNPGVGRFRGSSYGGYTEAYRGLALFDGFMDYAGYGNSRMGPMGPLPPSGPAGPRMPGGWGDNQGYGFPGYGGGMGGSSRTGADFISNTGHHVHMRGIPFAATQQDIKEFFSGVAIPTNIVFCFNDNGRKNGEADVEFTTHDEAQAAMSKNREHIGPRYIELFLHSNPRRRDVGLGDRDYGNRMENYGGGFGGNEGRSGDYGGSGGYESGGGSGNYNRGSNNYNGAPYSEGGYNNGNNYGGGGYNRGGGGMKSEYGGGGGDMGGRYGGSGGGNYGAGNGNAYSGGSGYYGGGQSGQGRGGSGGMGGNYSSY